MAIWGESLGRRGAHIYTYYEGWHTEEGIESGHGNDWGKREKEARRNEKYIRPDAFKPGPPKGFNEIQKRHRTTHRSTCVKRRSTSSSSCGCAKENSRHLLVIAQGRGGKRVNESLVRNAFRPTHSTPRPSRLPRRLLPIRKTFPRSSHRTHHTRCHIQNRSPSFRTRIPHALYTRRLILQ